MASGRSSGGVVRLRARSGLMVCALALLPASVAAQPDRFAAVIRDLMALVAGTPGAGDLDAVAERMGDALDRWDRAIRGHEARVERELRRADRTRAFQLHVELGLMYRARGRFTDALRAFDAALSLRPSSDLQLHRAFTLDAIDRREAANAFYAAWTADPDHPVTAYLFLRRHGAGAAGPGDRTRALQALIRSYQRLLSQPPERGMPFPVLEVVPEDRTPVPVVADARTAAAVRLLVAHRFDDAIAALRSAGPTAPTGESPRVRFERSQTLEAEGRVVEARREYEAAIAGALAGRSVLYVGAGRLAQVEGDLPAAIDAFARASELDPNNPLIHRELAGAYMAAGRHEDAFVELVAALLIHPGDALTLADIGGLFLTTGRPDDAVVALRRALELEPARHELRFSLATALTRLGRAEEAARQLALFEQARRAMVDRQRQDLARDRANQEAARETSRGRSPGR